VERYCSFCYSCCCIAFASRFQVKQTSDSSSDYIYYSADISLTYSSRLPQGNVFNHIIGTTYLLVERFLEPLDIAMCHDCVCTFHGTTSAQIIGDSSEACHQTKFFCLRSVEVILATIAFHKC